MYGVPSSSRKKELSMLPSGKNGFFSGLRNGPSGESPTSTVTFSSAEWKR